MYINPLHRKSKRERTDILMDKCDLDVSVQKKILKICMDYHFFKPK
jgi:hypothetical protein